jgi:hypothetical protein
VIKNEYDTGKRGRRSYFDDMFGGFRKRKEMEREFEES